MAERTENEILSPRARKIIGVSLAAVVVGCATGMGLGWAFGGENYQGFAVPADGGTLKIYAPPARSSPVIMRLWGVHIPRLDTAPKCNARKEAGYEHDRLACGGKAAMRGLWAILLSSPEGTVSCQEMMRETFDGEFRVYGRCVLPDGERDVAEIMLRNGWGISILGPDAILDLGNRYAIAENLAKKDKRGLWGDEVER